MAEKPDPFPPLAILQEYERLIPGSAELLLRNFAAYAEARAILFGKKQEMEFTLHQKEQSMQSWGQIFAFLITITALGGGIWIALNGNPWPGSLLSSSTVGAICVAFIKTRKAPREFSTGEASQMDPNRTEAKREKPKPPGAE
jgi:uncharacterized membrane protein